MSIYEKLFDYQKEIVDKFKSREAFGLFLDMGLGKTPLSLGLSEANDCNKVIVVSLNSKALESETDGGSWVAWGKQMKNSPNCYNKKQINKGEIEYSNNDLFCINYESLYSHAKEHKSHQKKIATLVLSQEVIDIINSFDANDKVSIILDESHKVKNAKTITYLSIKKLLLNIKAKGCSTKLYLCTGTPFTCGLEDLVTQLNLLGLGMSMTAFKNEFCIMGNKPFLKSWEQPIVGYRNVERLYDIVHQYAITIKSGDVIKLPETIFKYVTYDETKHFKLFSREQIDQKYIKDLVSEDYLINNRNVKRKGLVKNPFYRDISYPDSYWWAETKSQEWLRAREMSIGFQGNRDYYSFYDETRLNVLRELLRANPDNYIIFYNFIPEFVEIYAILNELGYNIDIYNGDVKDTKYYDHYVNQSESERYNNKKNVILSNFASGSTGKNWQAYNKCIMFSLPLFSDYEQGIKRIHRLGQKETCIYYIFYQNNYLDSGMLKALREKKNYDTKMYESDTILYELNLKKAEEQ